MAANTRATGIADPADGAYQDWFELYNPGENPVNLEGWYLSDVPTNRFKFRLPAGSFVPAHGYRLVWADEETEQNAAGDTDLHVNFKLSQEGESIVLSRPDGTVADIVEFGPQAAGISQVRYPDGAATIFATRFPTPRAPNRITPLAPAPQFASIDFTPEERVVLTLVTVPGQTYQVEVTDDLNTPDWLPLEPARIAEGASLIFRDSSPLKAHRYYRAIARP
jgi:hypothetical protein